MKRRERGDKREREVGESVSESQDGEDARKAIWEEGHEDSHAGTGRCREDQYPA